jgi:N-acyl-D-amino-acid deacylase
MVLGDADKQPTPEQLEQMKRFVRGARRDGAVGISSAMQYAPAPYARTQELISLASEASRFGGIYATHKRDEGGGILLAID